MMISLNATLIVQVINFGIAYILFRAILFKPAVATIEQERAHLDALNERIANDRKKFEDRKQVQREQWLLSKEYFGQHTPETLVGVNFFRGITPSLSYTIPSEQVQEKKIQEAAHTIVTMIGPHAIK